MIHESDLRTALYGEHVDAGATLTPFAGWLMPLRYGSDLAEHRAVREAAGLFDLSHMSQTELVGPGAGRFLDETLVGNLSGLAVGRARYTMLCAADGGVLDDLVVYRTGEETYLVVGNAVNATTVRRALTVAADHDGVHVRSSPQGRALIAVQGPAAEAIVRRIVAGEGDQDVVSALRYYACATVNLAVGDRVPAMIARTGYTGEDGFEVYLSSCDAVAVWRSLLATGAGDGLAPAGLAARDSLRLEAGMPLYGHELDTGTTPWDAGLGRIVRLDKTDGEGRPVDFPGRAALAALANTRDPAARTLVGLRSATRRSARAGYQIRSADGLVVGTVTSGMPSPTLGYPIALAYVTGEHAEGTELSVDVRGRAEPFVVVPLPFYRRSR